MPNVNAITRDRAFWPFYVHVSDDPLEGGVLDHFDVVKRRGTEYTEAVICLPSGNDWSLDVAISPGIFGVNLDLRNTKTNTKRTMGWWDDARWHPFALRWSELIALHMYWLNNTGLEVHPSAAFLLLAIFVGNGHDERDQFADRKNVIREQYSRLNLYSDSELTLLTAKTLVLPTENDYNWTHDEGFGWVFRGEYPCYSLRNREHSDGSEGRFPFDDWSQVIANL